MAEFTYAAPQTVAENGYVLFTDDIGCGSSCILHRSGAGSVTLRGMTNQCRARYRVSFGGNIAIPTGGTVAPISVSIGIDGETSPAAVAIVTPAAVGDLFNVYTSVYIEVPRGCCVTVAVINTSGAAITVQNANMIVERIA